MKKKILTLAISALFNNTYADNNFYLKGGIGLNSIKDTKFSNHDFEGKIKLSDSFPLIEMGLGYKFDNGIRLEGVIDYYFLFRTVETSTNLYQDIFNISGKTKADCLMLNVYKDLITVGKFTPFVGGGIGISHLKESAKGHAVSREDNIIFPLDTVSKQRKQLAYKLTLGGDIKITDSTTCEISYNYFNLGNNKRKVIGGVQNVGNRAYEIHNVTIGLRVSI